MNVLLQKFTQLNAILIFLLLSSSVGSQNLEYLGLNGISNVRSAQVELAPFAYWPKTQVIDSLLYVPTRTGIYRKNLNAITIDTLWQHYAFHDQPIHSFIKKNDSLIGTTAKLQDSLLLLSVDNGYSYSNHTSSFFFDYYDVNAIWGISKHPIEPETFVVLHNGFGVARTTDFGTTWTTLNQWIGGYQDWFVSYHPNDGNSIFYTGEQAFFESYIFNSYDSGQTWAFSENIPSHCTHTIAFHPTNPNIMLSGGEGRIAKSTDKGLTWSTKGFPSVYVFKIIFDENNPEILYATGDYQGVSDTIKIYRSTDGGEHWSLFYSEDIPDSDGIMDIHLYNNYLYVYTLTNGVFRLSLESLSTSEEQHSVTIKIIPNPTENHFSFKTTLKVKSVKLYSVNGTEIESLSTKHNRYDVRNLSAGIYFLKIETQKDITIKKLIKK